MANAATEQATAKYGAKFAAALTASVVAGAPSSAAITVADNAHKGVPSATVLSNPFTVTSLSFNMDKKFLWYFPLFKQKSHTV